MTTMKTYDAARAACFERAQRIADAVLLEGYALYPYRSCSTKNRYRWTFGVLAPRTWSESSGGGGGCEPWFLEAQVLCTGRPTRVHGRLRFLHVIERRVDAAEERTPSGGGFHPVERLEDGERVWSSWEEGQTVEVDLVIDMDQQTEETRHIPISIPGGEAIETLRDDCGKVIGRIVRTRYALEGAIIIRSTRIPSSGSSGEEAFHFTRLTLRVENVTPYPWELAPRTEAVRASFASTHLLLATREPGTSFVSLVDPPDEARAEAALCENVHTHPVLVGAGSSTDVGAVSHAPHEQLPQTADLILCAPIILGDHPRIAPESPGDFFDGAEIDELLMLRTRTLTPDEKVLARSTDLRVAALLDRVEMLGDDAMQALHGTFRERTPLPTPMPMPVPMPAHSIAEATPIPVTVRMPRGPMEVASSSSERPTSPAPAMDTNDCSDDGSVAMRFAPGTRVRLRPNESRRTDAQDLLYAGLYARVEHIRQDVDGTEFLAVTIEGDPAADLHRWYGRFHYYRADEVELVERLSSPLEENEAATAPEEACVSCES